MNVKQTNPPEPVDDARFGVAPLKQTKNTETLFVSFRNKYTNDGTSKQSETQRNRAEQSKTLFSVVCRLS